MLYTFQKNNIDSVSLEGPLYGPYEATDGYTPVLTTSENISGATLDTTSRPGYARWYYGGSPVTGDSWINIFYQGDELVTQASLTTQLGAYQRVLVIPTSGDCTSELQAAIDDAYTAGGGTLILPAGIYTVGSSWIGANSNIPGFYALRLKSNVWLVGQGQGVTVLKVPAGGGPGSGGNGAVIGNDQTSAGTTNMRVASLTIDMTNADTGSSACGVVFGNPYAGQVAANNSQVIDVEVSGCPYISIQNRGGGINPKVSDNYLHGAHQQYGVQIAGSNNFEVTGNRIDTTSNNAIDLYCEEGSGVAANGQGIVTDNIITAPSVGVFCETSANVVVTSNVIVNPTSAGIEVNRINSEPQGNVITGNTIVNAPTGIIVSQNVYETAITGNTITVAANGKGISLNLSFRNLISNNTIRGVDDGATITGIELGGAGANNTVSDNVVAFALNDIVDQGTYTAGGGNMAYNVTNSNAKLGGGFSNDLGVSLIIGSGVPASGVGANGDTYFRTDGAAGTFIYQKRAGAWVASSA